MERLPSPDRKCSRCGETNSECFYGTGSAWVCRACKFSPQFKVVKVAKLGDVAEALTNTQRIREYRLCCRLEDVKVNGIDCYQFLIERVGKR